MYRRIFVMAAVIISASRAIGDVTVFANKPGWEAAVRGNYSTIDFTGFADGTPISNQYLSEGVTFSGLAFIFASAIFVNDGWGLHGPGGLHIAFGSRQNWVGVDYPGAVEFQLFNDGQLFYTSPFFQPGGVGNFAGLVSDTNFDEVYIFRPAPFENQVFIDDLHWGPAIPAPGALGLFFVTALSSRRRRE